MRLRNLGKMVVGQTDTYMQTRIRTELVEQHIFENIVDYLCGDRY
jgi:hypothetical protein